jgi:hypothetical protein
MFAEPLGSRTGGRAGSHKAALEAEGSSDSRASAHSRSRVVEDAGTLRGNNAEVVSGKVGPRFLQNDLTGLVRHTRTQLF